MCFISTAVVPVRAADGRRSDARRTVALAVMQIPVGRAAKSLRSFFPGVRIAEDPASNSVVVTALPGQIEQIRSLLSGLDVQSPVAPAVTALAINHTNKTRVESLLRSLFPAAKIAEGPGKTIVVRATANDTAQMQGILGVVDAAPASIAAAETVTEMSRVDFADPKVVARQAAGAVPNIRIRVAGTSLVLFGPADAVARAQKIIAGLDRPQARARFAEIYQPRYYDARSVAALIARSFRDAAVQVENGVNAFSVTATARDQRRIANAVADLDAQASSAAGGGAASGDLEIYTLKAALPGSNGNASTSAADLAAAVLQALSGIAPDLRITVVPASQRLILTGSAYGIAAARNLLGRLDVVQSLVVLDTQILEVDETLARDLGLTLPQPVISSIFSEVPPSTIDNQNARLIKLQPIQRTPLSLALQLNLLVQKGKARVLADPHITTVSGRTATIRAGDTISVQTTAGGGAGTVATTQLQTFQTGVTLDITPVVNADNYVTVTLHPTVNSQIGFLNGIPQIATRDTETTVALREDQTLVIGGLIQESSSATETKIPLLGDIPIVGRIFRDKQVNFSRNELVITVTPHIIKPDAAKPGEGGKAGLPQVPEGTQLRVDTSAEAPALNTDRDTLAPAPLSDPRVLPPAATPPTPAPSTDTGATPIPGLSPAAGALPNAGASPVPAPSTTPSALGSVNRFTYGSVPPSNFAKDADPVQIFYATFAPSVVAKNDPINIDVVTTSNANAAVIKYGSGEVALRRMGPGQWSGTVIPARLGSTLPSGTSVLNLQLVATSSRGAAVNVTLPVNITP